ncbi:MULTISPECIES: abhydrolase domain-containing 18 [unclassified Mycolicibacterium]|uniref:abhydrolase domain-containing 18 n=1 Tax=unclassified Mycolicibacterium TaxID=2636767 RepID=UPI002ED9055F
MTLAQRATLTPHIALDEAALAVMRRRRPPNTAAAEQTAADIASAAKLFAERGWLATPAQYHRTPPPLIDSEILCRRTYSKPFSHETMSFASGFRPRAIEPGAARWPNNDRNDTVSVRVLRRGEPRAPWVICLHGFRMGASRLDLALLWANYLHAELGFNVALPVSPLHGARKAAGDAELLSLDLTGTLHGITQSTWDVRRLVNWIRGNTDAPVGGLRGRAGTAATSRITGRVPGGDRMFGGRGHLPRHVAAAATAGGRTAAAVSLRGAGRPAHPDRAVPRSGTGLTHVGFTWSRAARGVLAARMRDALGRGCS